MAWVPRLGLFMLAAALVAAAAFFWLSRPAALPDPVRRALAAHTPDPEAGERIFWAAGCAGCHARPGLTLQSPPEERLVLSGGRRLHTDFGTFVVPNVSMHPTAGIGRWSLDDFARATLLGVAPDGRHYYPAFPYTSYSRMRPEDVADLWAFWQTLPQSDTPSAPHALRFPLTIRRGVGLWKALFLDPSFVTPEPEDAELARGRYLVEALAHCGECHTPRRWSGALDQSRWLAGAANPSGEGQIPPLPPRGWSAEDIAGYLFSGFTPEFDVVGGSMADVVAHLARLPAEDRAAIATYLLALDENKRSTFRSMPNR